MSRSTGSGIPTSWSSWSARSPGLRRGHLEVRQDPFDDLGSHCEHRVQAGHRVLKDHPDPSAAYAAQRLTLERKHVGVAQPNGAAGFDTPGRRDQLKQGQAGEALAAARLAHQRQRLAALAAKS